MNWMDKAFEELDDDLAAGLIAISEYNQAMRDIYLEYEQQAQEAAQERDRFY